MAKRKALLDTVKLDEAPTMVFRIKHRHEVIAVLVLCLLFFVILTAWKTIPKRYPFSWNDESRIATIEALVENPDNIPRFAIDYTTYGWWTGDKIFDGKHFYSTKPPVLSVLGAGIYYILHNWFNMDYSKPAHEGWIYFTLTLFLMVVPTSITIALFYDLMRRLGIMKIHAVLLTATVAVGSLMLPYTTVFNNHVFAGSCIFIAFYFLFKAIEHRGSRGWNLFFSGVFAGLSLTVDIAGAGPFAVAEGPFRRGIFC